MASEGFITLISTISGGILAVIGGFFSNYFLHGVAKKAETKIFYRQQLEEIFCLSHQIIDYFASKYTLLLSATVNIESSSKDKIENPIPKIKMINYLYFPELKQILIKIEESVDNFNNGIAKLYLQKEEDKSLHELFINYIDSPYQEIKKSCNSLLGEIEHKISNYI